MNNLPVLFSFRRCPYAIRARMAVVASGLKVELREVLLKDKPDELTRLSAKATVPVLRLEDGTVLDQSLDILNWALTQSDPQGWKEFSSERLAEMETLVLENDDSFKVHLDRYKYADRHPGETQQTYRARCDDFLAQLETRLQRSSYLFGERASYADIAIFPFIRQFSKVEEKWFATRPYPALAKWLENFIEDDRFQLVMKKYKPWVPSDALVEFPPD